MSDTMYVLMGMIVGFIFFRKILARVIRYVLLFVVVFAIGYGVFSWIIPTEAPTGIESPMSESESPVDELKSIFHEMIE